MTFYFETGSVILHALAALCISGFAFAFVQRPAVAVKLTMIAAAFAAFAKEVKDFYFPAQFAVAEFSAADIVATVGAAGIVATLAAIARIKAH